MYWIIALLWSIVGTILFWGYLSKQWKKIDVLEKMSLRTLGIFHSVPADPDTGYLRLQFSILRHAVVFLLTAVLIYVIDSSVITTILLFLNMFYCWSPISKYRYRKQDMEKTASQPDGKATASLLSGFVKDSFSTVVHAISSMVIIYILFAIKTQGY